MNKKLRISFNAPATLTFCAICFAAMILDIVTAGGSTQMVFSVYRSSLANPLTYVRFIGHIFGHGGWQHFFGNIMYIMILGPLLEEKYGSSNMVFLYITTGLVTGVLSFLFYPYVRMLGASGVVFALILLSSITKSERNTIPVTFLLVACLYIGQQVYEAMTVQANVAYIAHFGGGAVGASLGFVMNRMHMNRY